jgi:hypothetical protein
LGGKAEQPTSMKDEEWEVLDRKELGTIRLCLVALVVFIVSKEKTTKDLMETLAKLYEKPSTFNKVFLMKPLFNMNMLESGFVVNHLNEFNTVANQISSVGVKFDEDVRAILILCSLLERWNGLVMAVSKFVSGSNTLKFNDVVGIILSEEMRQKRTGETLGNALTVENRGRQKER